MNSKKIVIILLLVLLVGLFFWLDLGRYITLESLKTNHQLLLDYYDKHALQMVVIFMVIYIIQTGLALPGATILSLAAGAVFGPYLGTVYAVTAASLGALLSFLVTRYLLRDTISEQFGNRLKIINKELEERGFNYLLFLRLVPIFPFFLINLAAGLTRIKLSTFALGTLIGIIPGGFVYVNAGSSLASISSLSDIASPRVLGSFVLLGCFALVPVVYVKLKGSERI